MVKHVVFDLLKSRYVVKIFKSQRRFQLAPIVKKVYAKSFSLANFFFSRESKIYVLQEEVKCESDWTVPILRTVNKR